MPVRQIGNELEVQYLLQGSVRGNAAQVRITTELIHVSSQKRIWARVYDRTREDVLNVQGEVAQEVADEIGLTLGNNVKPNEILQPPRMSAAAYSAYDSYLKGRYFLNKRTAEGFNQAAKYFEQAIASDPRNARAYAGLADCYALMTAYDAGPSTVLIPKARAAALKALELDEKFAEAHVSLALIAQNYDWDWPNAEKEFQLAIRLDPNYATAHHWYAEHLAFRGRFDEAFKEMSRARQIEPLSLIIQADDAAIFYFSRRYDLAIEKFLAVLEMEPNFPRATMVVYAYAQKGQFEDALAAMERSRQAYGDSPWAWSETAYIYGRAGQTTLARSALQKLAAMNRVRPIDPMTFAEAYIGLGEKDRALEELSKAVDAHSPSVTALLVNPTYDPLRSDPRFQQLLRTVHLSE